MSRAVPSGCLAYPPKWLQAWNEALGNFCAAQKADQDLEALCVLYVALTRAKEATFVILKHEKPRMASPARDWILSAIGRLAEAEASQPTPNPWDTGELLWQHGSPAFAADKQDEKTTTAATRTGDAIACARSAAQAEPALRCRP